MANFSSLVTANERTIFYWHNNLDLLSILNDPRTIVSSRKSRDLFLDYLLSLSQLIKCSLMCQIGTAFQGLFVTLWLHCLCYIN